MREARHGDPTIVWPNGHGSPVGVPKGTSCEDCGGSHYGNPTSCPAPPKTTWIDRWMLGKPASKDEPRLFRLMRRTVWGEGCWEWTGYKTPKGYGRFMWSGQSQGSHRMWYEEVRGQIPEGYQLDHLCRNKGCVNPWHLEAVTPEVNNERAINHCVGCNCFTRNGRFDTNRPVDAPSSD